VLEFIKWLAYRTKAMRDQGEEFRELYWECSQILSIANMYYFKTRQVCRNCRNGKYDTIVKPHIWCLLFREDMELNNTCSDWEAQDGT